jgi:NNP family nitrate/nitrite transporter-like MFS transporter
MVAIYGFCFGIELTMNNIIVSYLFDNFTISLTTAGLLGSLFGLMNLVARSLGGQLSDLAGSRFGMRGRLWTIWIVQTLEGVFCIAMGLATSTLPGTIVLMVMFSPASCRGRLPCGSSSPSALGVVSGQVWRQCVHITQTIFFKSTRYTTDEGIIFMGVMILCVTMLIFTVWFPMWGGMVFPARSGATEEDYYLGEYSAEERAAGIADVALRFANESKSQRGRKALAAEAAAKPVE